MGRACVVCSNVPVKRRLPRDLPGGPVVRLHASTSGDTGSVLTREPGFHMLQYGQKTTNKTKKQGCLVCVTQEFTGKNIRVSRESKRLKI